MTDRDKNAVYAAEQQVRQLMDTAEEVDDWTLDFHGYTMTLPQERKFADLASIERYYGQVCTLTRVQERWPGVKAPKVAERTEMGAAHYETWNRTVKIPMKWNGRWAQRELVVLHELAHHMTPYDGHGAEFRGAYVFLVGVCMGQEIGMVLGEQMYEQVGTPFPV